MPEHDTEPQAAPARPLPRPLPLDPVSVMPEEVARGVALYRAGDADGARAVLRPLAEAGRTSASGEAAAALAGIELAGDPADPAELPLLRQVAAGEDPWLGPLAAVLLSQGLADALSWTVEHEVPPAGHPLVRGIVAQLTGDREAARAGYEQAMAEPQPGEESTDLAQVLLANLLLSTGADPAEVDDLLTDGQKSSSPLYRGYACHLLAHSLIRQGDLDGAAEVLRHGQSAAHPVDSGSDALLPWVCVRSGELLASAPYELDLVAAMMEDSGVSEGSCIRQPFEEAAYFQKSARPALADVGFHAFPDDAEEVRAALDRLREWSDERYERGRALCLLLCHRLLADETDRGSDRHRSLSRLVTELTPG
ncbi:hypothetical protein OG533_24875 [Streptomyces sp. NBC_01186]|uniref:hypothetical protein n=1 Tax=unclassified Streptomyces TaxID=2593676 RepID=UPI002DDA6300|nr:MULTISPECIES: hypothetical protein [unclassified Streptomyces]WSB76961.1 hypothetical protein OHB04_15070 [Streptomyces sp. NBC_01775]WSS14765.1 hypothetical protein OG533_24875 [Streptomyces sp. NBC_01186]